MIRHLQSFWLSKLHFLQICLLEGNAIIHSNCLNCHVWLDTKIQWQISAVRSAHSVGWSSIVSRWNVCCDLKQHSWKSLTVNTTSPTTSLPHGSTKPVFHPKKQNANFVDLFQWHAKELHCYWLMAQLSLARALDGNYWCPRLSSL